MRWKFYFKTVCSISWGYLIWNSVPKHVPFLFCNRSQCFKFSQYWEICVKNMYLFFSFWRVPGYLKNVVYRLCIRATGDQPVKSERESGSQNFVAVCHVRPSVVWGFSFQCLRMQDTIEICFRLFGFWAFVLYSKLKITGSLIWRMLKIHEDSSVIDILKALVPGNNLLEKNSLFLTLRFLPTACRRE